MDPLEKPSFSWLIEEANYQKAGLRYAIKHHETQLCRLLWAQEKRIEINAVLAVCRLIISCYETLRQSIQNQNSAARIQYALAIDKEACYDKITQLQLQLCWQSMNFDENNVIHELIFYYRNFYTLLSAEGEQDLNHCDNKIDSALTEILSSKTAENWLHAIVTFACHLGENFAVHHSQLLMLSDKECLHLYHQFSQVENMGLLQSLYQLHKQEKIAHVESFNKSDELNLRRKLNLLYLFIKQMHKTIIQSLQQHGFNPLYDSLFSVCGVSKEPVSVQTELLLIQLVDRWNITSFTFADDNMQRQQLAGLLKAYKYWFNPNMLIDATMHLYQRYALGQEEPNFSQQLIYLYQHLLTSECQDLYGYFSNNDTRYMMRTLYAAGKGITIRGLPDLNNKQRTTVMVVHDALKTIMLTLLEELKNRHFYWASYSEYPNNTILRPGGRILQAIMRITSLYNLESEQHENRTLEQLFAQLNRSSPS